MQNIDWEHTRDFHLHDASHSLEQFLKKINVILDNKFCRAKDNKLKSDLHNKFKKYGNLILTLSRKSKDSYFKSFFGKNKKSALKIWQDKSVLVKTKPTNLKVHTLIKE